MGGGGDDDRREFATVRCKCKVQMQDIELDVLQHYSRQTSSGVAQCENKNTNSVRVKIAQGKGVYISETDLRVSHRQGSKAITKCMAIVAASVRRYTRTTITKNEKP